MKAVFVFSHPMAFRAWDAACERLQEQGIEAIVISQMSVVDWPDPDQVEAVQQAVLSLDGDLEERMGPVSGEFQGGSVDIFTRDQVDAWNYRYRVK